MYLANAKGQFSNDIMFDASGSITTGGTAQLVLPVHKSRASFLFVNNSDTAMYLEIGSARATATVVGGKVTSVSVTNAGFGFTIPPLITFLGGGNTGWNETNSTFLGCGQPGYNAPSKQAVATATLTANAVSAITVHDGGAEYARAPYVLIQNSPNDPFGAAVPSATSGILVAAFGGSVTFNGATCPVDPISVFCATTGKAFTCKYMI